MEWTVKLAKAAARQLEKVPRNYRTLLFDKLREMAEDPFRGDVLPLKGEKWKGRYRKRVGKYRIIFLPHAHERTLEVTAILARDEKTYR